MVRPMSFGDFFGGFRGEDPLQTYVLYAKPDERHQRVSYTHLTLPTILRV